MFQVEPSEGWDSQLCLQSWNSLLHCLLHEHSELHIWLFEEHLSKHLSSLNLFLLELLFWHITPQVSFLSKQDCSHFSRKTFGFAYVSNKTKQYKSESRKIYSEVILLHLSFIKLFRYLYVCFSGMINSWNHHESVSAWYWNFYFFCDKHD